MPKIDYICVYCGSSAGENPIYIKAAEIFGETLAKANIGLVYGGGSRGIMGAVAQSVKAHGGNVIGIIPEFLLSKEAPDAAIIDLDELIIVDTMHRRKTLMFEKADAFVTFPGGIGTLEEIIEMMTWAQLGHHNKPMVFANINDYWNPLADLLRHMADEGFFHSASKVKPLFINNVDDIIPLINNIS